MATLLAIDTATDALSLALVRGDELRTSHEVMPRRHQQELFQQLTLLCDGAPPAGLGLDAIVYGRGPGSFTGLRIAVSAAQGLAYSLQVPVIGVSTLETQARTLLRRETIEAPATIVSTIDARIGQVYAACYALTDGGLIEHGPTVIATPEALTLPESVDPALPLFGVGTGFAFRSDFRGALQQSAAVWPELLPEARDMFGPAREALNAGSVTPAAAAVPDYVQRRIGWKTLAEQGRRA